MSELATVEIATLKPHPDNPRRGDVPAIMRSLERFGQQKPIVVQRSTGYVVAGNHTLEAARRLGWTTIQAVIQDLDDETARAYLIADNRTSDKASYDKAALGRLVTSVLSLEGTGFNEDDLEVLREELSGSTERRRQTSVEPIRLEDREAEDAGPEPMREVTLLIPASQIGDFGQQVADLQRLWGARTLIEIIRRAVSEAHERWQASVDVTGRQVGSAAALPPELVGTEY